MDALTRVELDVLAAGGCQAPGCKCREEGTDTQLYMRQQCHQGAPTSTYYNRTDGVLVVECAVCERPLAVVKVAER